jgi:hypothetical protein
MKSKICCAVGGVVGVLPGALVVLPRGSKPPPLKPFE